MGEQVNVYRTEPQHLRMLDKGEPRVEWDLVRLDTHLAALASARAEVDALRKERDRLRGAVREAGLTGAYIIDQLNEGNEFDADALARELIDEAEIVLGANWYEAAREPGRSGA